MDLPANAIERAGSTEPTTVAKAPAEASGFKAVTDDVSFTRPDRVPVMIVGVNKGSHHVMERWSPKNKSNS